MIKQDVLNGYQKMRQEISKTKDEYLAKIFIYIKAYFSMDKSLWSWETFYEGFEPTFNGLEKLIFDSLTETYAITAAAVKKIYGIKFNETINQETLEKLTYSKDGQTLEQRIHKHYDEAVKKDNPTLYFYNRMVLIMDTETLYASNHVIHGKLNKYATHVEVINANEDFCLEYESCEYWVSKGKMPIEELDELPPYHPDCECEVIYYIDEEKI